MKNARNFSAPFTNQSLKEHMADSVTTLATCWKLVSKPNTLGVIKTVAATSHTRDLVLSGHSGITFLSAQGVVPSAVDHEAGLGSSGLEVDAIFVVDVLSEESIASGDWDSSYFEVFVVNYEAPEMGELVMFAGFIGDVKTYGDRFRAEGRPLSSKASQEIGNLYVPKCIARNFGDNKCKHPLGTIASPAYAGGDGGIITVGGTVTGGGSNVEFTDSSRNQVHGYFDFGIIEFTSGVLAGRQSEVQSYIGTTNATIRRISTDSTWLRSSSVSAGWQNQGYDDSAWLPSVEQGVYGSIPWGNRPVGFDPQASPQWIWSRYSPNTNILDTVYFRKKFTPNVTSAVLKISVDNTYTVWLDGVQIGTNNQWETYETYNLTFTAGVEHVLAIEAANGDGHIPTTNNPAGVLAEITFAPYSPSSTGGVFKLATPMPRVIEVGTTYKAIRGCDRKWETCKNIFANLINFRGFPFVPGVEKAYKVNQ